MSAVAPEPVTNGISVREQELLTKVKALEDDRIRFVEIVRGKIQKLEKDLADKTAENERVITRNSELESSLKELGALTTKGKKPTKAENDDLLTRARELLFEKTKICKQQELQLEALNNQVDATKDVLEITKDMLNLRNIEADHQQARLDSLQLKCKAERDRFNLAEKKLAMAKQMELHLRKEYLVQSGIFKDLRDAYEAKIEILTRRIDEAKKKVQDG